MSVLFPEEPRDFPGRRGLRSILRAGHILTTGVLLGGHVFAQPKEVLLVWLVASVATGAAIFLTDLHASFGVLCELRGALVLIKIGLVAASGVFWDARIVLLVAAVFIGAIGSHMPGTFRHRVLFLRHLVVADRRHG